MEKETKDYIDQEFLKNAKSGCALSVLLVACFVISMLFIMHIGEMSRNKTADLEKRIEALENDR